MDQIYQDFNTKLLPQIQQGLSITKDYFMDLFQRDIQYLIVIDTLHLVISAVVLLVSIILTVKGTKIKNDSFGEWPSSKFFSVVFGTIAITLGFLGVLSNINNLIKDKYVPEIRIYQQIQDYRNN